MRKLIVGFVLLLVIVFAVFLRFHHSKGSHEVAYAGNREVTVWSTSAQVREPVGTLSYGDRLEILQRFQDQVQVHTAAGVTGWIAANDLLSADLWQKAENLESVTAKSLVEARGRTKAISNLHIEPARDSPRIRQLNKAIPVDMFERRAAEVPQPSSAIGEKPAIPVAPSATPSATSAERSAGSPATTSSAEKKEDWWLVRAHLADGTTASGWLLGRFVDLDVPSPLPDYANSAGMHIVTWFELNRVIDTDGSAKPQYLLIGTRGPEGQPCDFTLMRVYTWGNKAQRYETAFVASDVCGRLPIKVTEPAAPGGEAFFTFTDWSKGASEQRTYHMQQTVVRRVGVANPKSTRQKHAHR
jgi:hypothetical protein